MYSSMQPLSSFALGLGVLFSLPLIASSGGLRARSLASRQAPGVVAPSDFLRRAGHACRFMTFLALSLRTDIFRSGRCWGLGVH